MITKEDLLMNCMTLFKLDIVFHVFYVIMIVSNKPKLVGFATPN